MARKESRILSKRSNFILSGCYLLELLLMARQKAPDSRLAKAEERVAAAGYVVMTKTERNAEAGLFALSSKLLVRGHINPLGHLSQNIEILVGQLFVAVNPGSLQHLHTLSLNLGGIGRL